MVNVRDPKHCFHGYLPRGGHGFWGCKVSRGQGSEGLPAVNWRGGRVVYCTGLENRRTETFRGFESRPLRHCLGMNNLGSWIGGFCSESERKSEHNSRSFPSFHRVPERGAGVARSISAELSTRWAIRNFFAPNGPGVVSCPLRHPFRLQACSGVSCHHAPLPRPTRKRRTPHQSSPSAVTRAPKPNGPRIAQ